MKKVIFSASLITTLFSSAAFSSGEMPPQDELAAFNAAGFENSTGRWKSACNDTSSLYSSGKIDTIADINHDGLIEVIITEGSLMCFGNTAINSILVSKQTDGSWKKVFSGVGTLRVVSSSKSERWAEIEIGGPGFCFPIYRFTGSSFELNRYEYESKSCKKS